MQLAYVTGCDAGDSGVAILDLARGTVQEIAPGAAGQAPIRSLTWSPDGRTLAYEVDTAAGHEVALVGAGATTLADQVTVAKWSSDSGAGRPSFRPDGSLLYVVGRDPTLASGPATLVSVDLHGGAPTDLLSVPTGVVSLSVSAQGAVAFVDTAGTLWRWQPDPAGAAPTPVGKGFVAVGW
jgi:Tol biopolymer transport system component